MCWQWIESICACTGMYLADAPIKRRYARFSVNVIEQGSYPVTEEWLMIKNFRREILAEIMLTEKNKSGMIITC